ncbi:MAG: DNA polymerase III subunit epsilon, partial [Thermoanaerobaculia bacterium]|nr:DNA polymerase III subunit epsilon [Thermoanaerobaculia bacterium]
MLDFVTIDFETANEFRDSPCEIGLTFVANSKIQETKSWLIKPKYDWFNPFNIYIHGISESDVKKSPTFDV